MELSSITAWALAFTLSGGAFSPSISKKTPPVALAPVVFSSPADESSVTATVPVRAVVSTPSVAVNGVTFYLDGVQLAKSEGNGGAFKWDTTRCGDGWHTLSAVAQAEDGRVTETKLAVMVKNFKDVEAPKVALTWPTDGSPKSGSMVTRASVSDNIGVTSVEAYVDGKRVAVSTTAPFDTKWSWKSLKRGSHTLQLKAFDAAGNVGASSAISFTK